MGNFESRVVIAVDATTTGAIRGFNALGSAVDAGIGKMKSAFDSINRSLDVVQMAVGKAQAALQLGKFAADFRQLEAALGDNLKGLKHWQDATDGTVSKLNLMKFATKAMNGELALTQEGMRVVLAAADNLNDKGFGDTIEIAEKLTDQLRKGTTKGLAELGIQIIDTGDKQKNFNGLIEEYKRLASDTSAEDTMAKKFDQFATDLQNATDQVKRFVGEIVITVVGLIEKLIGKVKEMFAVIGAAGEEGESFEVQAAKNIAAKHPALKGLAQAKSRELSVVLALGGGGILSGLANEGQPLSDLQLLEVVRQNRSAEFTEELGRLQRRREVGLLEAFETATAKDLTGINAALTRGAAPSSRGARGGGGRGRGRGAVDIDLGLIENPDDIGPVGGVTFMDAAPFASTGGRVGMPSEADFGAGQTRFQDALARGGGPSEEIEKLLGAFEEVSDAQRLFTELAQSTTVAMLDAVISGEANALGAVRKRLAGEMKGEALKYGAKAIGYAADLNFYSAAKAAAAAAAFTAGAMALGAGGGGAPAGGGGGGGGSPASSFPSAARTRGAAGGEGMNVTINVGHGFHRLEDIGSIVEKGLRAAKRSGRSADGSVIDFE